MRTTATYRDMHDGQLSQDLKYRIDLEQPAAVPLANSYLLESISYCYVYLFTEFLWLENGIYSQWRARNVPLL